MVERCATDGRSPKLAVVITVAECFIHCAKAFRRGAVWDSTTSSVGDDRPSAAAIINEHLQLGLDPAIIEADLEAGYATSLWRPGGDDDAAEADPVTAEAESASGTATSDQPVPESEERRLVLRSRRS
ncbi:MAG: hypothetical protein R2715_02555 [Ilumatobacteraceae bacterium]